MDEFNVRFVPDTAFVRTLSPFDEQGRIRKDQRIELRIGESPGPYRWMAATEWDIIDLTDPLPGEIGLRLKSPFWIDKPTIDEWGKLIEVKKTVDFSQHLRF